MRNLLFISLFIFSFLANAQDEKISLVFLTKLLQDSSVNSIELKTYDDTIVIQKHLINKTTSSITHSSTFYDEFQAPIKNHSVINAILMNYSDTNVIDTNGSFVFEFFFTKNQPIKVIKKSPVASLWNIDTLQVQYNEEYISKIITTTNCQDNKSILGNNKSYKCREVQKEIFSINYKNNLISFIEVFLILKNGKKEFAYRIPVDFKNNKILILDSATNKTVSSIEYFK
tara:strand:+ start:123 stop:809 length:687 start_codon:yes stop_codon:yes gene_type:complete